VTRGRASAHGRHGDGERDVGRLRTASSRQVTNRRMKSSASPETDPGDVSRSDDSDVLGFLALPPGGDVEFDSLALVERLVAVRLDVGEVDEHVVALLT